MAAEIDRGRACAKRPGAWAGRGMAPPSRRARDRGALVQ